MTFNDEFFNALVRRQIGLMQLADGTHKRVLRLLRATEADLRAQLEGLTPARTRKILEAIGLLRSRAWAEARDAWIETAEGLVRAEPQFIDRTLSRLSPVVLETTLPAMSFLSSLVSNSPIRGRTLRQWAQGIERADLQRITDAIRIGLTQGETGPQIARRVVGPLRTRGGVVDVSERDARSISRTMVNSFANQAKRAFYEENAELFSGEIFLATLDSRTTLICASNDNKIFPVGKGLIPPLHWNCRSLRMAIVSAEAIGLRPTRDFTEQSLLREYSERQGLKKSPKSRDGLPFGTKTDYDRFARKRKRELTGQAPAKLSYSQWLKRQPIDIQDDILGKRRAQLFRSGKLSLDRFVNSTGRVLTLEELEAIA